MAEGNGARVNRLQQALDDCLIRLRRGDSLERCLEQHTEERAELRPLLELALRMQSDVAAPPAPPHGLAAARARLLSALAEADGASSVEQIAATRAAVEPSAAVEPPTVEPSRPRTVHDALDAALRTLVETGDEVAAKSAAGTLSGLLEPLIEVAASATRTALPVPPPPNGLQSGKTRYLALAAGLRASREAKEADPATISALDAAIDNLRTSRTLQSADTELSELLVIAQQLEAERIAPPPPPAGLAEGRARLLEAARGAREQESRRARGAPVADGTGAAAGATGGRMAAGAGRSQVLRDFLDGWIRPVQPRRLAASAIVALAVLVLGNVAVLAPVSAESLPGEPLYPIKRLNEQIALALTFDAERRETLRDEFNARRVREIEQSVDVGTEGETEVEGRLSALWRVEEREDPAVPGRMSITTLDAEDKPVTTTLAWGASTQLELGDPFGSLLEVPMGSELKINLRLRGDDRLPVARRIRLLSAAKPTPVTPVSRSTAVRSETPTATRTDVPPTETGAPSPTPTLTPSPVPATATPSPTPTATRQSPPISEPIDVPDLLVGILESKSSATEWNVRLESDGRRVEVDVSGADNLPVNVAVGHEVQLEGRWRSESLFAANHLRYHGPALCDRAEAVGVLLRLSEREVVLEGGAGFVARPGESIAREGRAPKAGDRVRVIYDRCGAIQYAVSVEVQTSATPAAVRLTGTVARLEAGRLELVRVQGRAVDEVVTVTFDPDATPVTGGALAVGAIVEAEGSFADESRSVLRATRIAVLVPAPTPTRAEPVSLTATPEAPGPATPTTEAMPDPMNQ